MKSEYLGSFRACQLPVVLAAASSMHAWLRHTPTLLGLTLSIALQAFPAAVASCLNKSLLLSSPMGVYACLIQHRPLQQAHDGQEAHFCKDESSKALWTAWPYCRPGNSADPCWQKFCVDCCRSYSGKSVCSLLSYAFDRNVSQKALACSDDPRAVSMIRATGQMKARPCMCLSVVVFPDLQMYTALL